MPKPDDTKFAVTAAGVAKIINTAAAKSGTTDQIHRFIAAMDMALPTIKKDPGDLSPRHVIFLERLLDNLLAE